MFKAIIESDKLKEMIEAVSSIVDEGKLNLSSDGISIKAVDPANVAMVSLNLNSDAFEEFNASEGELGVDLKRLGDIVDMAQKAEMVELELDEEQHKLIIRMSGLTYKIALLAPSSSQKTVLMANGAVFNNIEAVQQLTHHH